MATTTTNSSLGASTSASQPQSQSRSPLPHSRSTEPFSSMTQNQTLPYPSPGIEYVGSFPRIYTGIENEAPSIPQISTNISVPIPEDPFASQIEPVSPITLKEAVAVTSTGANRKSPEIPAGGGSSRQKEDGNESDKDLGSNEWDASKTPPSRFQQRKGSLYATPNSRDSHVDKHSDRDASYHQMLKDKGWYKEKRTENKGSG